MNENIKRIGIIGLVVVSVVISWLVLPGTSLNTGTEPEDNSGSEIENSSTDLGDGETETTSESESEPELPPEEGTIAWFEEVFFNRNENPMTGQILKSIFDSPADVDLKSVFSGGAYEFSAEWAEGENEEVRLSMGTGGDLCKLTSDTIDAFLQKYFCIRFEESNKKGLESFFHIEKYKGYYQTLDVNFVVPQITDLEVREDSTYVITYYDKDGSIYDRAMYQLSLKKEEGNYYFVSNKLLEDGKRAAIQIVIEKYLRYRLDILQTGRVIENPITAWENAKKAQDYYSALQKDGITVLDSKLEKMIVTAAEGETYTAKVTEKLDYSKDGQQLSAYIEHEIRLVPENVLSDEYNGDLSNGPSTGDTEEPEDIFTSEGSLTWFQEVFFDREKNPMALAFLTCKYSSPAEIDFYEVFYQGAQGVEGGVITEEERQAVTGGVDFGGEMVKLTITQMDTVLKQYMNVTVDQTNKKSLDKFTYLDAYNAYYTSHADTNLVMPHIQTCNPAEDGSYHITWIDKNGIESGSDIYELVLKKDGDRYIFVSNVVIGGTKRFTEAGLKKYMQDRFIILTTGTVPEASALSEALIRIELAHYESLKQQGIKLVSSEITDYSARQELDMMYVLTVYERVVYEKDGKEQVEVVTHREVSLFIGEGKPDVVANDQYEEVYSGFNSYKLE